MNAPNLARRLATRIIEGLHGRGRIVVVRGGTSALVRVIDDAISPFVASLSERFELEHSAEPSQSTRDSLTLLAATVARTLLSSEHLEDVFADRAIVEREVFEAALQTFSDESAERRANVMLVDIDTLGYVAATAARLASEDQLLDALDCAASSLGVKLSCYDTETREAMFIPDLEMIPYVRLELEEAVAEELMCLVAHGSVVLPVVERTRSLERRVHASLRSKLARVLEGAAARTLRHTGCAAEWDFPDDAHVRVVVTPLSEQDAREVDMHVAEFVAEVDSILAAAGAPLVADSVACPATEVGSHYNGNGPVIETDEDPESVPEPRVVAQRAPRGGTRTKSAPRMTPKRAGAKRTTKRAQAPAAEKSGTRKKATLEDLPTVSKKTRATKKG
ncbi:MAG TPA: hypothetical protein PK156_14175 [Polyangium sp.]|nr:hypothetical protein [Polyangium sp.]